MIDRLIDIVYGPIWIKGNEEACHHKPEEYVGSFRTMHGKDETSTRIMQHDVYLRSDNGVCIRHSDEHSDYAGIPTAEMLEGVNISFYKQALLMIKERENEKVRDILR